MSARQDDLGKAIRKSLEDIERVASDLPETAWSTGVYEQGWNAQQVLCHLAAGARFAATMIGAAQAQSRPDPGTFDQNAFNAAQVEAREDNTVAELLDELRTKSEQAIRVVQSTPDDVLSGHFKAMWGAEGPLADVIIEAISDHTGTHLAELRTATA
jgi:hypothetical protein